MVGLQSLQYVPIFLPLVKVIVEGRRAKRGFHMAQTLLEKNRPQPMTDQEINLSLDQASLRCRCAAASV